MRTLFLVVLYTGLCCSLSSQESIETLMDNVLVLRVPNSEGSMVYVPLTCGEAYENRPVFWKKNGEVQSALQGNQVKVLVEEMDGGNYTCHLGPDGEYLNHTVILIRLDPDNRTVILEEKSPEEGHIHCWAPNYKGSFHCAWTKTSSRSNAAVLLVEAERNSTKISCALNADGSGVECEDASCPYREEQHRILLTVYIHSNARLEAYTKAFFLREIVRPEKLPNLRSSDGRTFDWDYPDTWEKPCTFFGLQYQVKVVHGEHSCHSGQQIVTDTIENRTFAVNVKARKYVFCVRAQDKHTNGPFSPWSHCTVSKQQVKC